MELPDHPDHEPRKALTLIRDGLAEGEASMTLGLEFLHAYIHVPRQLTDALWLKTCAWFGRAGQVCLQMHTVDVWCVYTYI